MNTSLKRIVSDIKDIHKNPIEGIYYMPDEDNICYGYALIIGPEGTPYEYGYYFFKFEFSETEYPYKPPKVTYNTNDGITRFNPNFYKSGKVCLSILNTWPGEKWSSCQSLRSVLITLQYTMNEKPLLNEPGITMDKYPKAIHFYSIIIAYKNIDFAIYQLLKYPSTNLTMDKFDSFITIMKEEFIKNKDKIIQSILKNIDEINSDDDENLQPVGKIMIDLYSMKISYNYPELLEKITNLSV